MSSRPISIIASIGQVFSSWRMFIVLLLGIASGLPLALSGATLQAWMTESGLELKLIGLYALVGVPYTCKFFWSPLMDHWVPPFLGRRRGWMLICQLALVLSIVALSFSNPAEAPSFVALIALLIAFFSASQDIVIDAYRAEILKKDELGAGAGVAILGYRLGMLTSGAFAMIMADHLPWRVVYLIMAGAMSIGIFAALAAEESVEQKTETRSIWDAVIQPLIEYFRRRGAWEIIAFILLYKLGEVMAVALTTPFMLSLGFSKTQIGAVTKFFGLIATICGSLLGGAFAARLGMKRALLIFGVLQAVSPLCFAVLAVVGKDDFAMALAVGSENFFVGLGTAPFIGFLMGLCNKRYTATQYALLTSIAALCRVFAASPTGFLVEQLGWTTFFVFCAFASIPGLVLLALRYDRWEGSQ